MRPIQHVTQLELQRFAPALTKLFDGLRRLPIVVPQELP